MKGWETEHGKCIANILRLYPNAAYLGKYSRFPWYCTHMELHQLSENLICGRQGQVFIPIIYTPQMHRIEGFRPLPYMGITSTHTIVNKMSYFKINYI